MPITIFVATKNNIVMRTKNLPVCLLTILLILSACLPAASQSRANEYPTDLCEWMRRLPDSLHINRLSIPGTHDSGARYGGSALQTQTTDIATQLKLGIRAFDIRLKKKGHKLGIYHSTAFQHIYWEDNVLPTFIDFLKKHPSETLIVSLKKEGGGNDEYSSLLSQSLDNMDNRKYFIDHFHANLTLKECRGKILFLHRDHAADNYPGAACQGWQDDATCLLDLLDKDGEKASAWLQDEYQYASEKEAGEKIKACIHYLEKMRLLPDGSSQWGISFASATGLPSGTPQAFANKVNPALTDYLRKNNIGHTGILFIDFIEQTHGQKLVSCLINANFADRR